MEKDKDKRERNYIRKEGKRKGKYKETEKEEKKK